MEIRFSDTVGFTYNGEHLCIACAYDIALDVVMDNAYVTDTDGMDVHELVSIWAARNSIPAYATKEFQTYDTSLFDSGDLPKAFEDAPEDETCGRCGYRVNGTYRIMRGVY